MTEEQLKQLTDFVATKRKEDLLKIREEIKRKMKEYKADAEADTWWNGVYEGLQDSILIIDKHLSKSL